MHISLKSAPSQLATAPSGHSTTTSMNGLKNVTITSSIPVVTVTEYQEIPSLDTGPHVGSATIASAVFLGILVLALLLACFGLLCHWINQNRDRGQGLREPAPEDIELGERTNTPWRSSSSSSSLNPPHGETGNGHPSTAVVRSPQSLVDDPPTTTTQGTQTDGTNDENNVPPQELPSLSINNNSNISFEPLNHSATDGAHREHSPSPPAAPSSFSPPRRPTPWYDDPTLTRTIPQIPESLRDGSLGSAVNGDNASPRRNRRVSFSSAAPSDINEELSRQASRQPAGLWVPSATNSSEHDSLAVGYAHPRARRSSLRNDTPPTANGTLTPPSVNGNLTPPIRIGTRIPQPVEDNEDTWGVYWCGRQ